MTDSQFGDAVAEAVRAGRLNVENTWVSRRWRYLYVAVNKAASSKVKMVLHQLDGYPLPADPFDVHARDRLGAAFVGKLDARDAAEVLKGPDWRRFAFVRNPYGRLYSAYKNKIADLGSPYVGVRAAIWREAGRHDPGGDAPPFEAFVRYVAGQPDAARDGHWRSQTGCLCFDLIDYDALGRVESFERDFVGILRWLGAPAEFDDGLDVVIGASEPSPAAAAYDAALARLAHEAYADDFAAFGYDRDSWRG